MNKKKWVLPLCLILLPACGQQLLQKPIPSALAERELDQEERMNLEIPSFLRRR